VLLLLLLLFVDSDVKEKTELKKKDSDWIFLSPTKISIVLIMSGKID